MCVEHTLDVTNVHAMFLNISSSSYYQSDAVTNPAMYDNVEKMEGGSWATNSSLGLRNGKIRVSNES